MHNTRILTKTGRFQNCTIQPPGAEGPVEVARWQTVFEPPNQVQNEAKIEGKRNTQQPKKPNKPKKDKKKPRAKRRQKERDKREENKRKQAAQNTQKTCTGQLPKRKRQILEP